MKTRRTVSRIAAMALLVAAAAPVQAQCEVGMVTASDGGASDYFGAIVSLSGDRMLVGTPYRPGTPGAAYVYRFDGTSWSEEAKLTPSDGQPGDEFGSVSLSGDLAVVGAYRHDGPAGDATGATYVYRWDGASWNEEAKLLPADSAAGDHFGLLTAVTDEWIFAYAGDVGTTPGYVYTFHNDGTGWTQDAKLTGSDVPIGGGFGFDLNVTDEVVVIGAAYVPAAYVFRLGPDGWFEQAKLTGGDGGSFLYGIGTAASSDVVVVGSPLDDDVAPNAGAAYVYRYDGTAWVEEAKLTPSDGAEDDAFGSVAGVDGDTIVVGAWQQDGVAPDAGAVYVYKYDGKQWTETVKLTASDAGAGDALGNVVVVKGDVAAFGATGNDDLGDDSGSVYVFAGLAGVDRNANGTPDTCEVLCPGDANGDGERSFDDLLLLLGNWGPCP